MNFPSFLRQLLGTLFHPGHGPIASHFKISSKHLKRKVRVECYRSPVLPHQALRLIVINDGQDLPRMQFKETITKYGKLYPQQPLLAVGLVAGDRLREYGTAGKPDYKLRGDLAYAHEQFVLTELLPVLERKFNLRPEPKYRAYLGFSLGGLNAFDIVWRNPDYFTTAGVFSGALWWRSQPFDPQDPDADRIVHTYVEKMAQVPNHFRCWLMAGTEDEQEDRNNNGIIDAIDDTLALQALLAERGMKNENQLTYVEEEGGRHEPATWGRVMPEFLRWWVTSN